jgi:SAM-dependent methyltransferase
MSLGPRKRVTGNSRVSRHLSGETAPASNGDLLARLVCPLEHSALAPDDGRLICAEGHEYPRVDGIPVLIAAGEEPDYARWLDRKEPDEPAQESDVDPYVRRLIGDLCGYLYARGEITDYPRADLRLPRGEGRSFLEMGCSWGRWSLAAAEKGYRVTGIDASLGGIRAARRIARQRGVNADYVVTDVRSLPFPDRSFDVVFSYNVFQHLTLTDARVALAEAARVARRPGRIVVQLPNRHGLRNLYNLRKIGFGEPVDFSVPRYWTRAEIRAEFAAVAGRPSLTADGYFSLNARLIDARLLPRRYLPALAASELLRRASRFLPPLIWIADSLSVTVAL